MISNANSNDQKMQSKEGNKGEGKSLFSYWNKAVDTIKSTANQFVKQEKSRTSTPSNTP